jgi:O-antigen/teichoic acid export membrane protein
MKPANPVEPVAGQTTAAPQDAGDVLDTSAAGGLLVRGGAIRFAGILAMLGLSVVMASVLTRHLGVVRFGQYTTVMSLVGVVAAITDAGMSNIGTREYAVLRGPERESMLQDLLALRVVLTLLGVGLATAFAAAAGYDTALLLGTVAGSLATVPLVVQHSLSIPLTAQLKLGVVALLELIRQALWVGGIVFLVGLGAGVFPLLSTPLLVNILLIVPTALIVRGWISARIVIRPRAWPPLLRATVIFSLATAVGTIYIYTTQILTSLVASGHESGLFAVSFRVFAVSAQVPVMLAAAALPLLSRAARDDRDRFAYAVERLFENSLVGGVGVALAMSAGAQFIVSVVAGPKFAAAAGVLEIQSFAMIASFLVACWSFALLSLRLYRGLLLSNAAALLVSMIATLTLASAYGAHGAAIATICGETTLAVGTLLALAWHRPRYRPRVPIVIKVMAVAACAAVISLTITMPPVVRPAVAMVVYGVGILAVRAAPPELKELIPRGPQGR